MRLGDGLKPRWRIIKQNTEYSDLETRVLEGYELQGGWPTVVSDYALRDAARLDRVKVGTLVNLPPYRIRLIDYDMTTRQWTAVQAHPSWRYFALRLVVSRRWQNFKYRVQATLSIWGIGHWPRTL